MSKTFTTAANSFIKFVGIVYGHNLKLVKRRPITIYGVGNGKYKIFRETINPSSKGEVAILVIGFRLKLIGTLQPLHWLFQHICILTTPFWSGLPGFRVKLWMVDPDTKNYLGIYDWRGRREASNYLEFLLPILKFFSVKNSVWAKQIHGLSLDRYLSERAV